LALVFSKSFYTASLNSYYTFYLISKFHVSVASAQIYLFAFLASVAVGTLVGGPVGDRIGRKYVLWGSIVGVLPFTLLLPYVYQICAFLPLLGLLTVLLPNIGRPQGTRLASPVTGSTATRGAGASR